MSLHANGCTKHPHPRKSAQSFLDAGWCAGSLRAWYVSVSRHHPEEAEAWLLPVVRQAEMLERRAARGK